LRGVAVRASSDLGDDDPDAGLDHRFNGFIVGQDA
jgi:hypothetical protein